MNIGFCFPFKLPPKQKHNLVVQTNAALSTVLWAIPFSDAHSYFAHPHIKQIQQVVVTYKLIKHNVNGKAIHKIIYRKKIYKPFWTQISRKTTLAIHKYVG